MSTLPNMFYAVDLSKDINISNVIFWHPRGLAREEEVVVGTDLGT